MTNWFQTHNINPIYGWGPSKRMIVQAGPAIDEAALDVVVKQMRALVDKARKAGCVYVEIRCFEDYSAYRSALEAAGFVYEPHYDVHIKPENAVPDAKMRQIRAAMAEGQTWRETKDEAEIKAWYACLKRLYRTKVKRPIPNLAWFREMIVEKGCRLLVVERSEPRALPNRGTDMSCERTSELRSQDRMQAGRHDKVAEENGGKSRVAQKAIIGGVLLAVEDDLSKAYEWYICGQVMSTWAAIDWCRQHGVRCFDTMGAGKPGVPYGVRDFKLQMGGELKEFGRYRCVLKPWLYSLGEWVMRSRK